MTLPRAPSWQPLSTGKKHTHALAMSQRRKRRTRQEGCRRQPTRRLLVMQEAAAQSPFGYSYVPCWRTRWIMQQLLPHYISTGMVASGHITMRSGMGLKHFLLVILNADQEIGTVSIITAASKFTAISRFISMQYSVQVARSSYPGNVRSAELRLIHAGPRSEPFIGVRKATM